MTDLDDYEEIFSHIEQIKKEKANESIEKKEKPTDESFVKNNSYELSSMKKSEENNEVKQNIPSYNQTENLNKKSDISSLDESIRNIDKVSRMTTDHVTFKNSTKIKGITREISSWNIPELQRGNCDLCGETIEFEDNLSGLTIAGNFFACEKCCKNNSKEELTLWTKSKMNSPSEVRPIGLWVIQEKNKDRKMLSKK